MKTTLARRNQVKKQRQEEKQFTKQYLQKGGDKKQW